MIKSVITHTRGWVGFERIYFLNGFLDKIYSSDHGLLYCDGLTYSRQQAKQKGLFKLTTFLTE